MGGDVQAVAGHDVCGTQWSWLARLGVWVEEGKRQGAPLGRAERLEDTWSLMIDYRRCNANDEINK